MQNQTDEISIEDLILLRGTVENWIGKAEEAVLGFKREDGSFAKDSKAEKKKAPHITTSARAYIALLYADRTHDTKKGVKSPTWVNDFRLLMAKPHIGRKGKAFTDPAAAADSPGRDKKTDVNIFDIAHLTDFFQVSRYLKRFHGLDIPVDSFFNAPNKADATEEDAVYNEKSAEKAIEASLLEVIRASKDVGTGFPGEVCFEAGRSVSRHYFATLHALRALHVLGAQEIDGLVEVVAGARSFAVEQCYYYRRGTTHRQDPVRLAFAGCIYAIYGEHIDQDLCLAIIEALAGAQQATGNWPATHPIFREDQGPWHIASHEVALCLSWLYFQPKVPDSARPLLISMMRKYLLNAVIPTYIQASSAKKSGSTGAPVATPPSGWQDDHTVSPDVTIGWATAIVCHFLAGFNQVLNDWINRQVIENLGLKIATQDYLIDDTASDPSPRWSRKESGTHVWPDLPPSGWREPKPDPVAQAKLLTEKWTDPSLGAKISNQLTKFVLGPIFEHASEQPQWNRCAGLMPGDPGTRKTSLVKQIAKLLEWPMVAVPASSIFEQGFDMMEARASYVFGLLNNLRGCVIFFDEFEEFFVEREEFKPVDGRHGEIMEAPASESAAAPAAKVPLTANKKDGHGSRTIAAFTTSAMLPRMQDLHDKTRCLIFLATNHEGKLDSAIKRTGRFDFLVRVEHPTRERMIEYLADPEGRIANAKDMNEPVVSAVKAAVEGLAPKTKVKFAIVEGLLNELQAAGLTKSDLLSEAKTRLKSKLGRKDDNPPDLCDLT